jgi:hypothetical protein
MPSKRVWGYCFALDPDWQPLKVWPMSLGLLLETVIFAVNPGGVRSFEP